MRRVVIVLVLICSIICVATLVRIERLNHLAGDAIQMKAQYAPNSKWRIGEGFHKAMRDVEANFRAQYDIHVDDELTWEQRKEILSIVRRTGYELSPRDRLGETLAGWGLLQYPMSVFVVVGSMLVISHSKGKRRIDRIVATTTLTIGLLALSAAIYRGYFSSLGW